MRIFYICFIFLLHLTMGHAAPIPVHEAFQLQAKIHDLNTLELHWNIQQGYYLYQDRLSIEPVDGITYTLGTMQLPKATSILDKQGKQRLIYQHILDLRVPILPKAAGEGQLKIRYQGCSDKGFCYPPQQVMLTVQFDANLVPLRVTLEHLSSPKLVVNKPASVTTPIESMLQHDSWPLILFGFFGFGLLLAFTPCVLPMIPVLSSLIISQRETISSKKAFFISLSFVLGLATTYALIGVCFALLGNNLQMLFQSPWTHGLLALLFMILALSMFDLFELRPPSHWQTWFTQLAQKRKGGAYGSSFLMGILSSLILSPCVTPPLVGTLAFIAHSGQVMLGGLALFVLGLGSGLPLLLISTSAAVFLPKAGHWMYAVKSLIGFLLLTIAIQLISNILPPTLDMALWGGLLLGTGVFIGALTPAYSTLEKLKQTLGLVCLLMGVLIFIGACMGNTNPFQPLKPSSTLVEPTTPILTVDSLQAFERVAKAHQGQAMMIDFYADWCSACKYMEAVTFRDKALQRAFEKILVIRVDLTKNDTESNALLKSFDVIAPPTFLLMDRQGVENARLRITGETTASTLIRHIDAITRHPSA